MIRVVTATNRELLKEVQRGGFRNDLYYRLNGLTIRTPSLEERPSDIPVLVAHFVELARRHSQYGPKDVQPEVFEALTRRHWPGNIRELRHAVERAMARARGTCLTVADFTDASRGVAEDCSRTLEEHEAEYIARVIHYHGGRVSTAAESLGIGRTTLYEKLAKYGLREVDTA